ncbi:FAR1 DNA-binding domain [Sesbania bispinosa]|nr:FAR1 DNA-binding domain [Sesbania bispinosa]
MAGEEHHSFENYSGGELEKKKIDEIHDTIPNDLIPRDEIEFETENAAYNFYNSYAYRVGFSVRISKGHKGHDGKMIDRVFCCSCEGYRGKDKREANTKNPRAQTRFGCLAKMKVNSRSTGKYRVTAFAAEHTHETTTPSKSHLLRSQRKITTSQASEVNLAEISGITPKASCELMARRVGGRENLEFIPED